MFASFHSVRDTLVSAVAALVCSAVLIGAAVVPAQTAVAATFGL